MTIRSLLIVLFVAVTPLVSFGQSTQTFNTPGTYTFTVPTGVTSITVEAWGAGGGGGNGGGGGGNGGGGGGYAKSTFVVTPGSTYYYTVGVGGLANNNGQNSIFESSTTTLLTASGGKSNGTGGTGTVTTGTSTVENIGGKGEAYSNASTKQGAGGGSSAGINQDGNPGSGTNGGAATLGGGAGGNGGNNGVQGSIGGSPGGGGGGGGQQKDGGNGGNGQIIIAYACPTSTLTTTGVSICPGGSGSLSVSGTCSNLITTKTTNAGAGSASGTGSDWINFPRIYSDDNSYTNSQIGGSLSKDLLATKYGFSIPTNAIINGVQVIIGRKAGNAGRLSDSKVQLLVGGTATGDNKKLDTNWLTSETAVVYGSSSDLWNKALTPAIINAANFGVVLTVNNSNSEDTTAFVDYIQIIVSYSIVGTLEWYTVSSNGTSIGSGASFNPVGVTGSGLTNTNTPASTTYYVECSLNPGCRTPANFVINSTPSTPTIGTITQPNCVTATGSVVLNGLPASGSWTITASPVTSGLTGLTGSGVSGPVSGLTAGVAYTFTVSNGTCKSLPSANVPINNVITTTYNGSTWSTTPDITMIGIIDPPSATVVTISSNTELCSCTVNTDKNAAVASGITLKLQDKLTVNGSGTLTFENNSSLVQVNDAAVNSGNIKYIRSNATTRETDYTYWSSPVANQKLINLSPKTPSSFFYSFNAVADDWNQENSANVMAIGTGYIIRGPHYLGIPPSSFYDAPFYGVPNNGNFSLSGIVADKSYLIGNPYPSALDADKFLADNSSVLDGTLYFWTHRTEIGIGVSNPGSGLYAYSSDDYASYNGVGGVAAAPAISGGVKPSGKIASGQAFFAGSKVSPSSSQIVFNNSMRVGVGAITGDNSQFFKINNTSKTGTSIEKNRIWLNLTNSEGAFKQTLLGYVTDATDEFDDAFDGESFDGNQFVDFYTINEDKNLTIQGRSLPFNENDEVPLGFSSTIEGVFSINIDEVDGLFTSQDIFLEDKDAQTITNLKEGAYTFTTEAGTFNDRFILRFRNTYKTLGSVDFNTLQNQVLVSVKNKQIKINSFTETIDKIQVYDLLGRQLFKKNSIDNNEFVIVNPLISEQALVVKIILQNGQTISKKIIY